MNNIKNLHAESAETYISTDPPSASGFHGNARQQTHTAGLHLRVLYVLQFSPEVREDLQTSDVLCLHRCQQLQVIGGETLQRSDVITCTERVTSQGSTVKTRSAQWRRTRHQTHQTSRRSKVRSHVSNSDSEFTSTTTHSNRAELSKS